MPFIDSKVTVPLTEEKKERIKTKLGQTVSLLNKSETYLMVGFQDNYDLYMAGKKLDKAAMLVCSKALGHNRISVVADNYIRGL